MRGVLDVSPDEVQRIQAALVVLARKARRPLWVVEGALATLVLRARIREAANERGPAK